jgi:hypothetical protein
VPTPNRRISVILSPELNAALVRLKQASGMSPASFIRQTMETSVPLILRMADAFEAARKNPEAGMLAIEELARSVNVTAAQLSLDVSDTRASRGRVRKARTR